MGFRWVAGCTCWVSDGWLGHMLGFQMGGWVTCLVNGWLGDMLGSKGWLGHLLGFKWVKWLPLCASLWLLFFYGSVWLKPASFYANVWLKRLLFPPQSVPKTALPRRVWPWAASTDENGQPERTTLKKNGRAGPARVARKKNERRASAPT